MSREPEQRTELTWPDDDVGWLRDYAPIRRSSGFERSSDPERSWHADDDGIEWSAGDAMSVTGTGRTEGSTTVGDEWRTRLAGLKPKLPTPTELADRLGVSVPAVVFGAVGVLAAMVGGWWALRPSPSPDPEVLMPTAGVVSIPIPPPETIPPEPILVHVAGSVAHPGVHELPIGSRVVDAVAAAGGLTADADADRLNLAAAINDGSRLWVPAVGEHDEPDVISAGLGSDGGADGSSAGRPGADGSKVNINTASADALQALPGIGPSLAAAIVENREKAGPFARVEDLDRVSGIGPAKLELLHPFVVV